MASRSAPLQDDQKFALMKFRRNVADVLKPEHDDYYLLRWLRARNWNPDAAEKMLRNSVKWRERWGVDKIESWKTPQPLMDYIVHGLAGYDREGAPFLVIPFGPLDMWGILHTVSQSDLIRVTIQHLEKHLQLAYQQSLKHGNNARQLVVLFDMDGFNVKQYTWRPAAEAVIQLIKMYEANYPEILKFCYIINAPKVFAFVFNMVRKFLDEYTVNKIHIYKADPQKWYPAIIERIDEGNVPKHYGGTLVDSKGDPKCQEFILWGGKVPETMYNKKDDENNNDFSEATIRKGGKLKMEFDCKDDGCFLKWEFRTYDHDIRFGIKCKNEKTGELTEEIPLKRVASHQLDEVGFITCHPNCKYFVVFDNTYSYLRNKKIRYSVILTEPMDEPDILDVRD
ncbi:SEC14-like protein 2 [Phlebotomus papatasi]|uniref:SEC14-like protein 2 n=1 Tax=Phlebotomus papatasi TaxID=29031 RepID=UPI002483BF87|nr:SEC14-like protein 2 [Phlebotomus papatasi]